MLQYNNWTIEQNEWNPVQEELLEQQLTFSNGYLCQTAHFEEFYSQNQRQPTHREFDKPPFSRLYSIRK